MRIDKYLKNSRLIKRRTVAKEACEQERILINDKVAKPGSEVNVGDVIWIRFGNSELKVKVKAVLEHVTKETAAEMYEII
ncbi:RNA-binding S4 domain-containing protein [Anaerovorax sp. IOR16]|uniref:RNA-binding S4 domain-containing protein n=1 Tax=Anaerovorax sp. IOR16 TaxID=2773458 RepID=UPI0019D21DC1|nr:RNA-binding S4 domain-containing protein [Anaerovorax sp. IOR16]